MGKAGLSIEKGKSDLASSKGCDLFAKIMKCPVLEVYDWQEALLTKKRSR